MTRREESAPSEGCLEPEVIAAYLDGGLAHDARRRVETHAADCDDCREVMVATARTAATLDDAQARPRSLPGHSRWMAAGVLSAAAVVALVAVGPSAVLDRLRGTPDSALLAAAVGPRRLIEGRLSGGFAHGPLVADTRSAQGPAVMDPEIVIASARIEQALGRHREPRTLTAFGAAQLIAGRVDEAIAALEEAKSRTPEAPEVLIDLSAAYLERSRRVPFEESSGQLTKAMDAARVATRLDPTSPEAWFNLALIQTHRGDRAGAAVSWREFLRLEHDPRWHEEGRRQLTFVESSN